MSGILAFVGVICLVIAVAFGLAAPTTPAANGAACGFAIAGGLCFLALGIAMRNTYVDTLQEQATRIEEQAERIRQLRHELEARPENWRQDPPQA
jgi:hypothetical protein